MITFSDKCLFTLKTVNESFSEKNVIPSLTSYCEHVRRKHALRLGVKRGMIGHQTLSLADRGVNFRRAKNSAHEMAKLLEIDLAKVVLLFSITIQYRPYNGFWRHLDG